MVPSMNKQRQRDVVGDAFGTHVIEERKTTAVRIGQARHLTSLPS